MWRIISVLAAIVSFVGVIVYLGKHRQLIDDDPYYLYGDSLYQGPMEKKEHSVPEQKDQFEFSYPGEPADIPSMIN